MLRRHGTLLLMLTAGLLAALAVHRFRGPEAVDHALDSAGTLLQVVVPSIMAGMLLAASLRQLIAPNALARWMGAESGVRGILIATLAGMAMPGGPIAAFPVVIVLSGAGADRGALIAFILAWGLNGFQRILIWELPIMGPDFALLRFLSGILLPVLAGLTARRLPIRWSHEDAPGRVR